MELSQSKAVNRAVEARVRATLKRDKSLLLLGPRQTGTTTLVNSSIVAPLLAART